MEEKTTEDQALDCLMRIMEFYHKSLFMTERKEITGIQEAKLRLLFWLNTAPMLSMSTLGKLLFTSKSHITTLVDALILDGLVERHPDPNDRRIINICITPEGRQKLETVKFQVRSHIQKAISNLHENDLKALRTSGEKLVEILSKVP